MIDTERFVGSIVGVLSCTEFLSCSSCNAKVTALEHVANLVEVKK